MSFKQQGSQIALNKMLINAIASMLFALFGHTSAHMSHPVHRTG